MEKAPLCVKDMCEVGLESPCPSLSRYADECKRAGVCLDWRGAGSVENACPVESANPDETWTECVSPCQKKYCHDEKAVECAKGMSVENTPDENRVSEFLLCEPGRTFEIVSGECVDECPAAYCEHDGQMYVVGDKFDIGCESCECNESGKVSCGKKVCPVYADQICESTGLAPAYFEETEGGCCRKPSCEANCSCAREIVEPVCGNSCHAAVEVSKDADCCPVFECMRSGEKGIFSA